MCRRVCEIGGWDVELARLGGEGDSRLVCVRVCVCVRERERERETAG